MKTIISELTLDSPGFRDGLIGGSMIRIPGLIGIAGSNGAGKSRLLKRIAMLAEAIPKTKTARSTLLAASVRRLDRAQSIALKAQKQIDAISSFCWDEDCVPPIRVIQIQPTALDPDPVETATVGHLNTAAGVKTSKNDIKLSKGSFLKIQAICNEFLSATHPQSKMDEVTRERAKLRLEALKEIVFELLGTSIEIEGFNKAKLFGRSMKASELSVGQKRLLAFATAFFEQGDIDADTIVIMDEPETHLHPQAVIQVLDKIKKYAVNAQIWIATHSLPLLASFEPTSLWCMKNGTVSYAGNRTEEVLESLMGGVDNIAKLTQFLSSPAEFAINTFVSECLVPPAVVQGSSNDPQNNQILEAVRSKYSADLKVLDWGAGRGRLATTLREQKIEGKDTLESLSYFAYDMSQDYMEDCLAAMDGLVSSPCDNYFSQFSQLVERFDHARVNVVTMANVLHEIEPRDWPQVLSDQVKSVVHDEGFLLIVEDLLMPHGELAHKQGFLVLDRHGIRKLFNDNSSEILSMSCNEPRYANRLYAHLVPTKLLTNVSLATVRKACDWQRKQAKIRIDEIRQKDCHSHQEGRELAFHLVQFANASIAAESLDPPSEINSLPTTCDSEVA